MSEQERNRALSRRWFEEVWNQGNERTIDELAAPNAACRGVGEGGRCLYGPAEFRQFYRHFRNAFSDFRVTIEDVLAEADKTAIRLTFTGRHTGDGLGVPPTGRTFQSTAIVIMRWQNGQIVEAWNEFDAAAMMGQLSAAGAGMKMRA